MLVACVLGFSHASYPPPGLYNTYGYIPLSYGAHGIPYAYGINYGKDYGYSLGHASPGYGHAYYKK